jgi:lysophospholipase L1-like esterase
MRRLGLTLIVLIAALLALEGVLRFMGARLTRKFEAELSRPLRERDCLNFLTLGESTTGGMGVDPSQSYPQQLARLLTQTYGRPICAVTPIHTGQNTSQMYNRFDRYMDTFEPRLVIFMCGVNNTWSLEESHIGSFLDLTNLDGLGIRMRLTLDRSRVFKLARMTEYGLKNWRAKATTELRGGADFTGWPPPDENLRLGSRNRAAFLEMWRFEVGEMIDRSKARGARVILMTYPAYDFPSPADFAALAAAKSVPLVRNDLIFKPLLAPGLAERYLLADGKHPRPEGYALIAAELGRLVEAQDLLGLRSSGPASSPPR